MLFSPSWKLFWTFLKKQQVASFLSLEQPRKVYDLPVYIETFEKWLRRRGSKIFFASDY